MTQQLSLAGDLGVHFYMDLKSLPEDALDDTYMEFTVSGKTVKVGFDPENMNAAGEYYGFTCRVNVLQMAENIHAVFHYGDSTVETDYSVENISTTYSNMPVIMTRRQSISSPRSAITVISLSNTCMNATALNWERTATPRRAQVRTE